MSGRGGTMAVLLPCGLRHAMPRAPLAALLGAALLSACVYLPRTTEVYDAECRIQTRAMELELTQIGSFGHCVNETCAAMLVAAGAVTAASVVVSGSVVIAGNIIYWFEKQGRCSR